MFNHELAKMLKILSEMSPITPDVGPTSTTFNPDDVIKSSFDKLDELKKRYLKKLAMGNVFGLDPRAMVASLYGITSTFPALNSPFNRPNMPNISDVVPGFPVNSGVASAPVNTQGGRSFYSGSVGAFGHRRPF